MSARVRIVAALALAALAGALGLWWLTRSTASDRDSSVRTGRSRAGFTRGVARAGQRDAATPAVSGDSEREPGGARPTRAMPSNASVRDEIIDLATNAEPEDIVAELCALVEQLPDEHTRSLLETSFEPYPDLNVPVPPLAFVEVDEWWLPVPEREYEVLLFRSKRLGAANVVLRSPDLALWIQSGGFGGIEVNDGERLIDYFAHAFEQPHSQFACDTSEPAETVHNGLALAYKSLTATGGGPGWKHKAFAGVGIIGSILLWSESPGARSLRVEHYFQVGERNWSVYYVPLQPAAFELVRVLPRHVRTSPGVSTYSPPPWLTSVVALARGSQEAAAQLIGRGDVPWAPGAEQVLETLSRASSGAP